MTDLANDEHLLTGDSMLCSIPRSCMVHTADHSANEGWCSCDQLIISMCPCVGKATYST